MAKFTYKMQNLLNIKLKLEEQKKIAFANATALLDKEEKKLQELIDNKNNYENKLRDLMKQRLNLHEIKICHTAIKKLTESVKHQVKQVNKAKDKLEVARLELNNAIIERKTHEKLKENEFKKFLIELEAEERKITDDLVSFKYNKPEGIREGGI